MLVCTTMSKSEKELLEEDHETDGKNDRSY